MTFPAESGAHSPILSGKACAPKFAHQDPTLGDPDDPEKTRRDLKKNPKRDLVQSPPSGPNAKSS